ncbi:MAG: hypothetical protein RugAbin2_01575 [Rugosibacter sp.]|nr:hypothetical protein [Rugosibacter sp.]
MLPLMEAMSMQSIQHSMRMVVMPNPAPMTAGLVITTITPVVLLRCC